MCLGVPGRVTETCREDGILMGKVDFGGVLKRVCLEYVPGVEPGKYVIVHVGFALSVIDEAEAHQIFDYLEQIDQLEELRQAEETDPPLTPNP